MDRLLSQRLVSVFVMLWPEPPDHCSCFATVVLSVMESSDQKMALLQEYCWRTNHCWMSCSSCLFLSSGLLSCLSGGNLETRVGYRYYFSEKRANTQRLQQFRLLQVAAKRFTSVHFHLISLPQPAAEKHHMTPSNHFLHFWTLFFLLYPFDSGIGPTRMTPS